MPYLLDTDICSYLHQGDLKVISRLQSASSQDRCYVSVVTEAELLYGILRAPPRHRDALRAATKQLLDSFPGPLPVTSGTAVFYAELRAHLSRLGSHIPVNDIWIASTAIQHGHVLVTTDPHFSLIPDPKTENWLIR